MQPSNTLNKKNGSARTIQLIHWTITKPSKNVIKIH